MHDLLRDHRVRQERDGYWVVRVKQDGAEVVLEEGYQPDAKDFTASSIKLKNSGADAVYLSSYYNDRSSARTSTTWSSRTAPSGRRSRRPDSGRLLVDQLVSGLAIGGVYALVALGFALIFGVLRVAQFAHGELYLLSAFLVLTLLPALPSAGALQFVLVIGLGLAVGAMLGLLVAKL